MFTTNAFALRTVAGTVGTIIFAGACLLGATAPAAAAEAPRTSIVRYSDLNLASNQGRRALDGRISSAARSVCETGSNDLRSTIEENRCVRSAVESVQPRKVATVTDYKG